MSVRRLLNQEATVVRRANNATDEYGNPVPGTETRTTYGARVQQVRGDERTIDRDLQTSEWVLFLPPEADITGRDLVEYEGDTYQVVGPPAIAFGMREPSHIEARMRHIDE